MILRINKILLLGLVSIFIGCKGKENSPINQRIIHSSKVHHKQTVMVHRPNLQDREQEKRFRLDDFVQRTMHTF